MRKPQGDLEWISKDGKMSWAHGEGEEAFQAGEKHEQRCTVKSSGPIMEMINYANWS